MHFYQTAEIKEKETLCTSWTSFIQCFCLFYLQCVSMYSKSHQMNN